MSSEYARAMGAAVTAAVEFGEAMARFQNALDDLAAVTPHCEVCRWASDRGHARWCTPERRAKAVSALA